MKVLHVVSTNERRGAEIFAADLVAAFARVGIDQRVIVLRELPGIRGVEYAAPVVLAGSPHVLPGLGMNAKTLLAVRRAVRAWRPDVVQVHGGEALMYGVVAAPREHLVYRRITATPGWMASPIRRHVYRALVRQPRFVIAVADALRRELAEELGLDPRTVFTIPNAIDPSRCAAALTSPTIRARLGISEATRVVVSVVALSEEKDPFAILKVAGGIRSDDVVFLVAGDGPLRMPMEQAIADQGLEGRVRLLGERVDVPDLLSIADVMLLTSRTEGMPGCLIEAAFAGLPVVATAVDGVPEVIVTGRTGLLVTPGDTVAMTACIGQLLSDGSLRRSFGRAAQTRALTEYAIDVVAPEYLSVYRRITSSTPPALGDTRTEIALEERFADAEAELGGSKRGRRGSSPSNVGPP